MRFLPALMLIAVTAAPLASAHGALTLNKFDTYTLSDFEGQEDSFPWEGFEIWDIYVGDGYLMANQSDAVYIKGNFAGDGTLRPSGSQEWTLEFNFDVGNASYVRTITHDGSDVTTDFEQLDWQIADGNVFQVHAWVPIDDWQGASVSNLVVLSAVDGAARDIAPGGIYDPATGQEIPVAAPPTPVFPAMGEGRIVESIPLTGPAKFLDVMVDTSSEGFVFGVHNTLAEQGQHFMVQVEDQDGWTLGTPPAAESLAGGGGTAFTLALHADAAPAPLAIDLMTDIGGLQRWYAYDDGTGIKMTDSPAVASGHQPGSPSEATPGPAGVGLVVLLGLGARMSRRQG